MRCERSPRTTAFPGVGGAVRSLRLVQQLMTQFDSDTRKALIAFAVISLWCTRTLAQEGMIMTVNGPVSSAYMGVSLLHEHVMVHFIGADSTGKHRWDRTEVIRVVRPYLEQAVEKGVKTIVECTPAY